MIRSRPFGNAAGSAARIAPSRRSEQLALVLLEIELSQEHIKNETPKKARGDGRCRSKFRKLGHRDFRHGQRAHVLHCVRCSRATLFCAILSDVHM